MHCVAIYSDESALNNWCSTSYRWDVFLRRYNVHTFVHIWPWPLTSDQENLFSNSHSHDECRDVGSVLNVSVSRRPRDVFLERLVSVLRVGENATSRSRLGLEGSTSRSCLGLESLKKWNVSVSSRSCDLTSCGHPWMNICGKFR